MTLLFYAYIKMTWSLALTTALCLWSAIIQAHMSFFLIVHAQIHKLWKRRVSLDTLSPLQHQSQYNIVAEPHVELSVVGSVHIYDRRYRVACCVDISTPPLY